VTTIAGTNSPGTADGSRSQARFLKLGQIGVDGSGVVYILDELPTGTALRRIDTNGVVSTLGIPPDLIGGLLAVSWSGRVSIGKNTRAIFFGSAVVYEIVSNQAPRITYGNLVGTRGSFSLMSFAYTSHDDLLLLPLSIDTGVGDLSWLSRIPPDQAAASEDPESTLNSGFPNRATRLTPFLWPGSRQSDPWIWNYSRNTGVAETPDESIYFYSGVFLDYYYSGLDVPDGSVVRLNLREKGGRLVTVFDSTEIRLAYLTVDSAGNLYTTVGSRIERIDVSGPFAPILSAVASPGSVEVTVDSKQLMQIESSPDLLTWNTVTNTPQAARGVFRMPIDSAKQFFRVRPIPFR
jgi:hypothetical protein